MLAGTLKGRNPLERFVDPLDGLCVICQVSGCEVCVLREGGGVVGVWWWIR